MKQNFHNILSQNFITTIEWQIFHHILYHKTFTTFFDKLSQHLITKHLITKHLITKHLITKHLIQNISSQNISSQNISSQNFIATNWVTDISPNSSPNSSSHFFIGPLFTTILSQQLYSNIFITNFNELFLRNIYVIVLQISSSQTFTNSLSQSLSDRCFDKLFTNIQMSYIFHHKHSQTLYYKV